MRTSHRRAAGLAFALAVTGPAQAHKASDAYLSWRIDGATVEQRTDIALRDLDRDLNLDADDNGALSWGEVRQRWGAIEHLAAEGVRVTADGAACRATATSAPQIVEHTDGRYAVLQRTLQCPRAVQRLELDYRLFGLTDAAHRGIARIVAPRHEVSAVLVPGAGLQHVDLVPEASPSGRRPFLGFVVEGVRHIAAGLDHILFLVTLLLVAVWRRDGQRWVPRSSAASSWKETLRLVTAFTLAHSLTLGLAASGVLAPPSRWVESLIAASVLVAAVDNLRPFVRGPRWLMVTFFGLMHGFGFAGPLQDLGLRGGDILLPLLGFNLGVELGQLTLVALLLPLACALRGARWYRLAAVRGGSAAIATLALAWTIERSLQVTLWP
jgi:hypothetical protein